MKRVFLSAALVFLSGAAAFAFSPEYINPRLGVMIINNVVSDGFEGAPDALVNTLGVSFSFPFEKNPLFSFEPGIDIYWTQYEWGGDLRAHPTEIESAKAAFVLGAMLDAPVFVHWQFNEKLEGMFGMGGTIIIRAALLAAGADSDTDVQDIGSWFYKKLRWFYPNAQLRLSYKLQQRFTFELMMRYFLPLFNVLDPDAPSFFDHSMLDITMGMRIKLK